MRGEGAIPPQTEEALRALDELYSRRIAELQECWARERAVLLRRIVEMSGPAPFLVDDEERAEIARVWGGAVKEGEGEVALTEGRTVFAGEADFRNLAEKAGRVLGEAREMLGNFEEHVEIGMPEGHAYTLMLERIDDVRAEIRQALDR